MSNSVQVKRVTRPTVHANQSTRRSPIKISGNTVTKPRVVHRVTPGKAVGGRRR